MLRQSCASRCATKKWKAGPIIARFFVNIGYADTLGSGVRNLVKYTKIYSDSEPELIEGEIFRTIIPLGSNVPVSVADKLPIN